MYSTFIKGLLSNDIIYFITICIIIILLSFTVGSGIKGGGIKSDIIGWADKIVIAGLK